MLLLLLLPSPLAACSPVLCSALPLPRPAAPSAGPLHAEQAAAGQGRGRAHTAAVVSQKVWAVVDGQLGEA